MKKKLIIIILISLFICLHSNSIYSLAPKSNNKKSAKYYLPKLFWNNTDEYKMSISFHSTNLPAYNHFGSARLKETHIFYKDALRMGRLQFWMNVPIDRVQLLRRLLYISIPFDSLRVEINDLMDIEQTSIVTRDDVLKIFLEKYKPSPQRSGAGPGIMEGSLRGFYNEWCKIGKPKALAEYRQGAGIEINGENPNQYLSESSANFKDFVSFYWRKETLIENTILTNVFPGGWGTLEELLELIVRRKKFILINKFWEKALNSFYELFSEEELKLIYKPPIFHIDHNKSDIELLKELKEIYNDVFYDNNEEPVVPSFKLELTEKEAFYKILERFSKIEEDAPEPGLVYVNVDNDISNDKFINKFDGLISLENDELKGTTRSIKIQSPETSLDLSLQDLEITEKATGHIIDARGKIKIKDKFLLFKVATSLLDNMVTKRIPSRPIFLVGKSFWEKILYDFQKQASDRDLFEYNVEIDGKMEKKYIPLLSPHVLDSIFIVDNEKEVYDILTDESKMKNYEIHPFNKEIYQNNSYLRELKLFFDKIWAGENPQNLQFPEGLLRDFPNFPEKISSFLPIKSEIEAFKNAS